MSDLSWYHHKHGDHLHDTVRFLIERYVKEHGADLLDGKVFLRKGNLACEPDVYFRYTETIPMGASKRKNIVHCVIEVETKATNESIQLKKRQYEESMVGIRLYVFNLDELETGRWNDWRYLEDWIGKRMPI